MGHRLETRVNLSARELSILVALANGKPSKEIAAIIGRSKATVEQHVEMLRAKFNAESRIHLVALAFSAGILTPRDVEVRVWSDPEAQAVPL
jgi:DNA-binding CsgD family transcriptional regulator